MHKTRSRLQHKMMRFKKNFGLTLLGLPCFIWFIVFSYIPLIGLTLAFKKYKIFGTFWQNLVQSKWVGLDNFKFLFATKDALTAIRNTIGYNSIFIILNIIIPLVLAIMFSLLINEKTGKLYQTLIFFPYFLSWVIINYFVYAFLSPDKGLVNNMLLSMGMNKVQWYNEPKAWPFLLVFLNTWKNLGYNIVIYLAAIIGIDRTYYEAASIDGATRWNQVRYITLPMVRGLVAVLLLMGIGKIFNSDIGLFYNVTRNSGALYNVSTTIDVYVYQVMKVIGDYGLSSAAAVFQSVVGFIVLLLANKVIRKVDKESALF